MADAPTVTLIVPTVSRPTLARTLASLASQPWRPGDEVLLVGDGAQPIAAELWGQFRLPGRYLEVPGPNRDWGHTPRNLVMPQARGDLLAALDDDDAWTPDALATIRAAATEFPGRPLMFRMASVPLETGPATLWGTREVRERNVGTPMFVVPRAGGLWGRYTPRYGGDCDFIRSTLSLWPADSLVWREEVICVCRPGG